MEHKSSKVKVYQTTDYSVFAKIEGNRALNKKKIDRIVNEIRNGNDILDEVPILVKEKKNKLEVLDGQHRLDIAISLKRPVHYIVHKQDMTMHNIANVNSNVEKWQAKDFINCYRKLGDKNYEIIENFMKEYGTSVGVTLTLLSKGSLKNEASQQVIVRQFETGKYKVEKEKDARVLMEVCKQFSEFKGWYSRPFIAAIYNIIEKGQCQFDVLLRKFKNYPDKLKIQANWKEYASNLEEVYNIDNSNRRTIY